MGVEVVVSSWWCFGWCWSLPLSLSLCFSRTVLSVRHHWTVQLSWVSSGTLRIKWSIAGKQTDVSICFPTFMGRGARFVTFSAVLCSVVFVVMLPVLLWNDKSCPVPRSPSEQSWGCCFKCTWTQKHYHESQHFKSSLYLSCFMLISIDHEKTFLFFLKVLLSVMLDVSSAVQRQKFSSNHAATQNNRYDMQ